MIKKIEQIIINKLIGQVEIWESELGVTFEPIVIPIIVNPKFLRNGGIENFKPKIALIEQTIVGPNRNGAGIFKNNAKKAPKDPRKIDITNSVADLLLINLKITELLIPLK